MKLLVAGLLTLLCGSAFGQFLNLRDQPFLARIGQPSLTTNNMVAWFKADSFPASLTNNAPIGNTTNGTQWVDQVTGAFTLIQATAASRPLFTKTAFTNSGGVILPAVEFASTASLTLPAVTLANNWTVIVIAKSAAGQDGMILGSLTLNRQFRCNRGGASGVWSFYDGSTERLSAAYTSALTVRKMSSCRYGSSVLNWRDNKANKGPGTGPVASTIFNQVGQSTGAGTGSTINQLCELVIYSVTLTDTDIDRLYDQYFKIKWGLP